MNKQADTKANFKRTFAKFNKHRYLYLHFFSSSSIFALSILHFMCSGGIAVAPPANLIWLFIKLFTSLGGLDTTGPGLSSPFILAAASSEASVRNKARTASEWRTLGIYFTPVYWHQTFVWQPLNDITRKTYCYDRNWCILAL